MAIPFGSKTKNGTVLLVVSLTVALGGWFGYTAWKETVREAGQWRLANDDMQRLLKEQAEQKGASGGTASRNETKAQTAPKSINSTTDNKDAASNSKSLDEKEQPASMPPANAESVQGREASANATASPAADPKPSSASNGIAGSSKESKLNINKATEKELDALPGIGESKAKAIVAYREKLGGRFQSVDQLKEVKGIGDKLLAKMKPFITVDP